MSATNGDSVFQSTIDPGVDLVKLLSIGRGLDFLLVFVGNYSSKDPNGGLQVTRKNLFK